MKTYMTRKRDETSPDEILEMSYAFQKSKALLTACELNIFTVLGDEEKNASEIADELDVDKGALIRLMNVLTSLGLLTKRGDLYGNTKETRRFLVKDSKDYLGNLDHLSFLYDNWSYLTEAIRIGKSPINTSIKNWSEKTISDFISSMHWRAMRQSYEIIEMIYISNSSRLLDLGGGSGAYTMEFVRAKPDLKAVVFELPEVIPFTQKYLLDNGFADKIETIAGDFMQDDIGSGYDIVFLSSVIHSYSIWQNIELAKKIYKALNPGGQIVIHDFIISDDRTKPVYTALFSLNMLINTESGDTYTETDVWIMLKEAWFNVITMKKTNFGTTLIIGKK